MWICPVPVVQKRKSNQINTIGVKQNNGLTWCSHVYSAAAALGAATTGKRNPVNAPTAAPWGRWWPPVTGRQSGYPSPFLTLGQHCPQQTDLNVFFSHLCFTVWQLKVTKKKKKILSKCLETEVQRGKEELTNPLKDNLKMERFSPSCNDLPAPQLQSFPD